MFKKFLMLSIGFILGAFCFTLFDNTAQNSFFMQSAEAKTQKYVGTDTTIDVKSGDKVMITLKHPTSENYEWKQTSVPDCLECKGVDIKCNKDDCPCPTHQYVFTFKGKCKCCGEKLTFCLINKCDGKAVETKTFDVNVK